MRTVAMILELAAPLQAGFHIRIDNEPWMTLVIEDTQERGPNGLPHQIAVLQNTARCQHSHSANSSP